MTNFQKGNYIGIDIGGTKIEGIVWSGGRILNSKKITTPRNRPRFLKAVEELIRDLKGSQKIHGIGLSCAGAIEERTGKIIRSPNMPYLNGLNLPRLLSKRFHVPTKIQNDTTCFLLGVLTFGGAKGRKNVVALTLGTGVGGAVLIDGRILTGSHVSAAELGHMVIKGNSGSKGLTVEDLCSSHFFRKFGLGGALEVQHKAERGNKKAKEIYRRLGRNLGMALANFVNIFDPELIILGGGISRGAHLFLKDAVREMRKHALVSLKHLLPLVKISKLKHAGALGAVSLFL